MSVGQAKSHPSGEQQPDSPLEIHPPGWKDTAKRAVAESTRDRVPVIAGSVAYHWFLALFPAMIALVGLTQILGVGASALHTIVRGVDRAVPPGASGVIAGALKSAHGRTRGAITATLVATAVSIWSASGGMSVLQVGLDVAYEVPKERKFLPRRLYAIVLMIVVLALGGSAAALSVFGGPLRSAVSAFIPVTTPPFSYVWIAARWAVTAALVVTLFALIYKLGPNRKSPSMRWLSPGGLVGATIWLAASAGLSLYVSDMGSYGKTYGAFAGVALLLIWFYLTALSLLLGAEINAETEREAVIERGGNNDVPERGLSS